MCVYVDVYVCVHVYVYVYMDEHKRETASGATARELVKALSPPSRHFRHLTSTNTSSAKAQAQAQTQAHTETETARRQGHANNGLF